MDNLELKAVARFLQLEGSDVGEIYCRMKNVYKDHAPCQEIIETWYEDERKRQKVPIKMITKPKPVAQRKGIDWPRPIVKKLIAFYKENEILWNYAKYPEPKNDVRHEIYKNIAKELHVSTDDICRKMHNLRSQWQGEARKVRMRNGGRAIGEGRHVSTWWGFNLLKFLDSEIIEKNCSNLPKNNLLVWLDPSTSATTKTTLVVKQEQVDEDEDCVVEMVEVKQEPEGYFEEHDVKFKEEDDC